MPQNQPEVTITPGPAQAVLTAALFNRAVGVLNTGKGKSGKRFAQWLLHYIFDEQLPLLRLLFLKPRPRAG